MAIPEYPETKVARSSRSWKTPRWRRRPNEKLSIQQKKYKTWNTTLKPTGLFAKTSNCIANSALPWRFWKSATAPNGGAKGVTAPTEQEWQDIFDMLREVRPRKNKRGFDLISDVLPFAFMTQLVT